MAIALIQGFKKGSQSKERVGIFLLLLWAFIHIVVIKNDRYTINADNRTILKNVTQNVYNAFMLSHQDAEYVLAKKTTITYFGIMPEWTLYIIYFGYFVILSGLILYDNKNSPIEFSQQMSKKKAP